MNPLIQNHIYPASVLAIASVLDYWIGDPWGWWHPVQGMGWIITRYRAIVLKHIQSSTLQRLAGIGLGLGLIVISGGLGWSLVNWAKQLHPAIGLTVESVLLASCFAGRSLRDAATDVLRPLQQGDIVQARDRLRLYVGRDTEQLSEPEILRAVLETVTENATDGVLAPLFYALLGAFIPGVGSLPFALGYKAVSTLDSMIGYRAAPDTHLGWFSAKLDDGLTWLPCRCVVLTLAILSGKPRSVWALCQRDAPHDPSPNSGWSECVYAAILGVQLGGINYYKGVAKPKPLLGDATHPIAPADIHNALQLTRICYLVWLTGAIAMLLNPLVEQLLHPIN